MDETATSPPPGRGRLLALFVVSAAGLVLALGVDGLPFAPTTGALAVPAEVLHLVVLAAILYTVGRLGATVANHDH